MAVPIARSGRNCQVRIAATICVCDEWTFSPVGDTLDVTNSELGGGMDQIGGCEGGKFTLKGFFDAAQNPYDSPMTLKRGQRKPAMGSAYSATTDLVQAYPTGTSSSVLWAMYGFYVEKADVSAKVRGRIDFDLELWTIGPPGAAVTGSNGCYWTYPTGNPGASS